MGNLLIWPDFFFFFFVGFMVFHCNFSWCSLRMFCKGAYFHLLLRVYVYQTSSSPFISNHDLKILLITVKICLFVCVFHLSITKLVCKSLSIHYWQIARFYSCTCSIITYIALYFRDIYSREAWSSRNYVSDKRCFTVI